MINVYFKGIITLKPFTYIELKNVNAYYGEALICTYQDEEELKGFGLYIEKSISKSFVPGNVIVNGRKKMFTELSTKPTNRYADCKVVAEGYKSTMNYTLPSI